MSKISVFQGERFCFRLPSQKEWEALLGDIPSQTASNALNIGNKESCWSWLAKNSNGPSGDYEMLGGRYNPSNLGFGSIDQKYGFRPICYSSVFQNLGYLTTIEMFSLVVNDCPIKINASRPYIYKGGLVTFTENYFGPDYLIPWLIKGDVAIARCNLLYISMNALIEQDYYS